MTILDVRRWGRSDAAASLIPTPRRLRARARSAASRAGAVVQTAELSDAARAVRWTLACFSILTAWLLAYALGFSTLQEHRSQHTLYAQFREQLALATAPTGGSIPIGSPVAVLTAPAAGLHNDVVVEGTGSPETRSGPGHLPDTVLPGQVGASVVFGRSVTFGAPFKRLPSLIPGATITATTGQGVFIYRVVDVRHAGSPLPPPLNAGGSQLTLVTSQGAGWRSGWAPSETVYVDAVLAHGSAVASPGHVSEVPSEMLAMHGDSAALVPVVFWLQALLGISLTAAWMWRRWGPAPTWLAGGALVLAAIWGASSSAVPLLPNLI